MVERALPQQIRDLVDGATPVVTIGEVRARAQSRARADIVQLRPSRSRRRGPARGRAAGAAAAIALLAAGGYWAIGPSGGPGTTSRAALGNGTSAVGWPAPHPAPQLRTVYQRAFPAFELASQVKKIRSKTESALLSGRAVVTERDSLHGRVVDESVSDISFDGKSVNDSITERTFEFLSGSTVHNARYYSSAPKHATGRIVDGRLYVRLGGRWIERVGRPVSRAETAMVDPRDFLTRVHPRATFAVIGSGKYRGQTLTELKATDPAAVGPIAVIGSGIAGARLGSLHLWVDGQNLVHLMSITESGPPGSGATATIFVSFSEIGNPQHIAVPPQIKPLGH